LEYRRQEAKGRNQKAEEKILMAFILDSVFKGVKNGFFIQLPDFECDSLQHRCGGFLTAAEHPRDFHVH
jgi:hypothetical protein